MLYWLIAVPARIGPAAIVATMGAISLLSVLSIVFVAHRRGGRGLMFLTAVGMVMTQRSLPAEVPYELWNTWAGLMPFIALIFIAWTVACGDYRLLPLLVLVASYVVQCDLAYVAPALGCVVLAVAGFLFERRGPSGGGSPFRMGRWLVATLVTLLLCWIAPLIDQVTGSPGNLGLVGRLVTSGYRILGHREAVWAIARAVGLPPLWLETPRTPVEDFLGVFRGPPVFTDLSALFVLACVASVLRLSLRRRRRDVTAAATLCVVLLLAVGADGAALPAGGLGFAASVYVLNWTSPVGMFAYLVIAWSLFELRRPRQDPVFTHTVARWRAGAAGLCILSVLVATRTVDGPNRLPPRLGRYDEIRRVTSSVVAGVDRGGPVLLDVPNALGQASLTFDSALAYAFRRDGIRFALPPRVSTAMGDQYCPRSGTYRDIVLISEGSVAPERGTTLLARSASVTVTLARAPSIASRRQEALTRREVDPTVVSRCR